MSVGRIPWSSINEYAKRYRITDFDKFKNIISELDDLYMEYCDGKPREIRSQYEEES